MRSNRAWFHQIWHEQPGLHRGYLADVLTAVALACALIIGGRQRTVAVVWTTLNESGGPVLWGCVFAGAAALLVAASFVSGRAMWLALWAAATPYGLLGLWFLQGALTEPSASFIGTILCWRAAYMHISRGDAYRVGPASWSR